MHGSIEAAVIVMRLRYREAHSAYQSSAEALSDPNVASPPRYSARLKNEAIAKRALGKARRDYLVALRRAPLGSLNRLAHAEDDFSEVTTAIDAIRIH